MEFNSVSWNNHETRGSLQSFASEDWVHSVFWSRSSTATVLIELNLVFVMPAVQMKRLGWCLGLASCIGIVTSIAATRYSRTFNSLVEAFAYRAQSRDELARFADEEIELGLGLVTFLAYGGLAAGGAFRMGHGGLDFLGHLCQSQGRN